MEEGKQGFFSDLEKSDDMNDKLQNLCDFLKEHTGATGCYVGYLQYPEVAIKDDAMDGDHLNTEASKVIKFTHATEDHQYIVGRSLAESQGITHDVFKAEESRRNEFEAEQDLVSGDNQTVEEIPEKDILESFKHLYIPEVVREKRMCYQRVPRLGSYMAIPLVYDHCLTDVALDAAVADFIAVQAENDAIKKE